MIPRCWAETRDVALDRNLRVHSAQGGPKIKLFFFSLDWLYCRPKTCSYCPPNVVLSMPCPPSSLFPKTKFRTGSLARDLIPGYRELVSFNFFPPPLFPLTTTVFFSGGFFGECFLMSSPEPERHLTLEPFIKIRGRFFSPLTVFSVDNIIPIPPTRTFCISFPGELGRERSLFLTFSPSRRGIAGSSVGSPKLFPSLW